MLGSFKYHNPTILYFGENSIKYLKSEMMKCGKNILLIYGGGSIKNNGIYSKVKKILEDCGKMVTELSGVTPNPTLQKLEEGVEIARRADTDFIFAVGGGSVIDYAKGLSVSIHFDGDIWQNYYIDQMKPSCEIVPLGCLLTMVGTGSEMNGGSVITNQDNGMKIGRVFDSDVFPKFAILDPTYTYSLPAEQMVAGIYDIMSHILEQYLSGNDDNTSDYIAEGLMRSLINSSIKAIENPEDYEARSNIMWTATWALNTLIKLGKSQDWMVHMIGHAISGVTGATHGLTLASVSIPYYRFIMDANYAKFARLARNVFMIDDIEDKKAAEKGIDSLKEWIVKLGIDIDSKRLGVTEKNIDRIVEGTIILEDGYKILNKNDIKNILIETMNPDNI